MTKNVASNTVVTVFVTVVVPILSNRTIFLNYVQNLRIKLYTRLQLF